MTPQELAAYTEALEYALKCVEYERCAHSANNDFVKPVPAFLTAIANMEGHLKAELSRARREKTPFSKRKSGTSTQE